MPTREEVAGAVAQIEKMRAHLQDKMDGFRALRETFIKREQSADGTLLALLHLLEDQDKQVAGELDMQLSTMKKMIEQ